MCCSAEYDVFEPPLAANLVDLLRTHASTRGEKEAFCFLRDHNTVGAIATYRELDERAMAIGGELQKSMAPGQRALLLFPPGLDFITAFFGCLYAEVVAVPVALPVRNRATSSLEAIVEASQPALILSTADHCERSQQSYKHLPALVERPWIATDRVPGNRRLEWRDPRVDGRQTAFLQYTSGSTALPKGVMLSHENLLHNAAIIQQAFGNTRQGRGVSWLPLYHDMGLIGGVIQPVYCGGPCALLAPVAFLQRPAFWLEAITRTRATVSGGPDFAYDLCVRKIPAEERQHLDLSSWKVAFTGAERVRAETIERFVEAFAPCGFRREAFFPCYGLAEATLMVSGGPRQTAPAVIRVCGDALKVNQAREAVPGDPAGRTFVGCGACLSGQNIVIVDPQTRLRCLDDQVGEIWVQGPSVAAGYYQQAEATEAAFRACLDDTGEGPYLRTGDLGFLREGQLFVTGRLKDAIIIRGRNHYPEDIEHSLGSAHPAFRAGYCAAFSIDVDNRERLVVVQEIEPRQRNLDAESALQAVRRAIADECGLEVYAIVLVKAGEVPKTSSGKTQRSACRERYLDGQLEVVAQWTGNARLAEEEIEDDVDEPCGPAVTDMEIEQWLLDWITARTGLPRSRIHIATPFLEFGLGSVDAVEIAAELERRLGRRISPTAVYNYPTIAALVRWLSRRSLEGDTHHERTAMEELPPEKLLDDVRNMTEADMEVFLLGEMAERPVNE